MYVTNLTISVGALLCPMTYSSILQVASRAGFEKLFIVCKPQIKMNFKNRGRDCSHPSLVPQPSILSRSLPCFLVVFTRSRGLEDLVRIQWSQFTLRFIRGVRLFSTLDLDHSSVISWLALARLPQTSTHSWYPHGLHCEG
jgi:hypothetical protein